MDEDSPALIIYLAVSKLQFFNMFPIILEKFFHIDLFTPMIFLNKIKITYCFNFTVEILLDINFVFLNIFSRFKKLILLIFSLYFCRKLIYLSRFRFNSTCSNIFGLYFKLFLTNSY